MNVLKSLVQDLKKDQNKYKKQFIQKSTIKNDQSSSSNGKQSKQPKSKQLKQLEGKLAGIEERLKNLEMNIYIYDERIDNLEQYSRSNCLIFHGIDFVKNLSYIEFVSELTTALNDNLPLIREVKVEDIDIVHPLPPNKKNKHSIIVKFFQRSIRNKIYAKKSNFCGTGIAITKSLTKRRIQILNYAQKCFGFKKVWTNQGKIFCLANEKKWR